MLYTTCMTCLSSRFVELTLSCMSADMRWQTFVTSTLNGNELATCPDCMPHWCIPFGVAITTTTYESNEVLCRGWFLAHCILSPHMASNSSFARTVRKGAHDD